jgi:hypothetical protein
MTLLIDFCSKDCKEKMHQECCGSWSGLNTNIICNCVCHSKKLGGLAEVVEPEANATNKIEPSKEVTKDD